MGRRNEVVLVLNCHAEDAGLLTHRLQESLGKGSKLGIHHASDDMFGPENAHAADSNAQVIDFKGLSATRLIDLKHMGTAQADTVILLPFKQEDGTNALDSDAKIITCCKVISLLRNEQLAEGHALKPMHLIVCLLRPSLVPLLETVTQQPGVNVEWLLPNELEGSALVQIMQRPALKPVYEALLEGTCDIYLIPAQLMMPYGDYTFAQISQVALKHHAVALGIRFKSGLVHLSPNKDLPITLEDGDRIAVVSDNE